jgi:hypothetical protein
MCGIRKIGQRRFEMTRAERAIDSDGKRVQVRHRRPECPKRLSAKCATATRPQRDRQHQWDIVAMSVDDGFDRLEEGLAAKRVDDRLNQQEVAATIEQTTNLIRIRVAQSIDVNWRADAGLPGL